MLLEVLGDQGLQQHTAGVVERPAIHQELGQGPGLVGDPGGEGGQQVVAADEVVLQGQDAEEQVAAGVPAVAPPPPLGRPRRRRGPPRRAREPVQVLSAPAARRASPQLPLQRHQLASSAGRSACRLGQVVLDPRRPARQAASNRSHASSTRSDGRVVRPPGIGDINPSITIPPAATPRG